VQLADAGSDELTRGLRRIPPEPDHDRTDQFDQWARPSYTGTPEQFLRFPVIFEPYTAMLKKLVEKTG